MKQKSLVVTGLLILLVLILFAMVGCQPVKYVMIDPKDTTKLVEVRKRIIYQDYYDTHIPLQFSYQYNRPYYSPIIIQQPIRVPQRPIIIAPRAPRGRGKQ